MSNREVPFFTKIPAIGHRTHAAILTIRLEDIRHRMMREPQPGWPLRRLTLIRSNRRKQRLDIHF